MRLGPGYRTVQFTRPIGHLSGVIGLPNKVRRLLRKLDVARGNFVSVSPCPVERRPPMEKAGILSAKGIGEHRQQRDIVNHD